MNKFRKLCFFFIFILTLPVSPEGKYDVFFYGGKYTETDLLPILFRGKTEYKKSYIFVTGLNYPLHSKIRFMNFEAEGQLAKHFGIMNHLEVNSLLIARIENLFYLPLSFAFGEGISIASRNPKLENKEKGIDFLDYHYSPMQSYYLLYNGFYPLGGNLQLNSIKSNPILNYLMVEFDYGIKSMKYYPRVFFRIHHRSGVFGFYCPPDPACGSNFISYGIKFRI
ncbi:MAG: hypothetical protein H7A23_10540 [Leptospiraceae bacterium]|nr:hypothetical protein [Leptospiraceae bacterium]MCP5494982.1 hypothetical protein [Leptospiraceae bacterium]